MKAGKCIPPCFVRRNVGTEVERLWLGSIAVWVSCGRHLVVFTVFFSTQKETKTCIFRLQQRRRVYSQGESPAVASQKCWQGAAHPRAEGQYSYLGFIQTIKTRLDVRFQDDKCCWDKVQPGQINTV